MDLVATQFPKLLFPGSRLTLKPHLQNHSGPTTDYVKFKQVYFVPLLRSTQVITSLKIPGELCTQVQSTLSKEAEHRAPS